MGSTGSASLALLVRGLLTSALGAFFAFILVSEAGAIDRPSISRDRREYERGLKAAGVEPYSQDPSGRKPRAICPAPTATRASCLATVVPERLADRHKSMVGGPLLEGSGEDGGYSPADLRSAYDIPETGGSGLTIAITIAYDYPTAESDLATYRETYGLPSCTSANSCFRKVNQKGEASPLPETDEGWAAEAALDLDMASAACPQCKLLLVEANSASVDALPRAVAKAAKLGADVISNSWGTSVEFPEEIALDRYFDQPGTPVLFASGDSGYDSEYPAASPNVIAVGGTSLHKDGSQRGWEEGAWVGAGSGCSEYEEKPSWQSDANCATRTIADVAAVADPHTPVSIYDTYGYYFEGWELFGGTSASTPFMAGIEALSSAAERAKGARLFWEEGPEGKLFDIGEGRNGLCRPAEVEYLCVSRLGYDGPTGWGTPGSTRPGAPIVGTYTASDVGADEVTLHGAVNPNGKEATYRFEYDGAPYTDGTSHGVSVPVSAADVGSGTEPVEVVRHLSGLTTGATYHYRLVASNASGTTYGRDHVFSPTEWSAQEMPFSAEQREELFGVSCPSESDCVAVGTIGVFFGPIIGGYGPYNDEPLVERWNGDEWTSESVPIYHPPASGYTSGLYDVSCGSPDSCIAVGENYEIEVGYKPMVERWDGSKWELVPVPLPSDVGANQNDTVLVELKSVSCVSATSCILVGFYVKKWYKGQSAGTGTLVEKWDGTKLTIQPSPISSDAPIGELWGVSCTAPQSCVAVGQSREELLFKPGTRYPLIERWDGTNWSIDPVPSLVGGLQDVSCSSESECMTVGGTEGWRGGDGVGLLWNGTEWSSSPPEEPEQSVSCSRVGWCVAVGGKLYEPETDTKPRAFAEIWDGSGWRGENPPLPSDGSDNAMMTKDVSCTSAACTAVGWYWAWGYQPLAERLDVVRMPGVPSVANGPVGSVAQTTAVLRAYVDNNAAIDGSVCRFELALKSDANHPIAELPCEPNRIYGNVKMPVHATATGLASDTQYVYRIVAENENGESTGAPRTEFSTLAVRRPLTVSKIGGGEGIVTSSPTRINCGPACIAEFEDGTEVKLVAESSPESEFREWGGACTGAGICKVTMSEAKEVTAFFSHAKAILAVEKVEAGGEGSGSVKARPYAINCNANCPGAKAALYKNTLVTLTARPSSGNLFLGWGGDCTGTGTTCTVTMDNAKTVTAAFKGAVRGIPNPQILTLVKGGTGQGRVSSSPNGIACELNCIQAEGSFSGSGSSAQLPTTVLLTATAAVGSEFTGWKGCREESGNVCEVSMDKSRSVAASFDVLPHKTLTLTKVERHGEGSGSVKARPYAINCNANCPGAKAALYKNTLVTLTARPSSGNLFLGWGGGCTGTGTTCTVTMDNAKTVTATFEGTSPPIWRTLRLIKIGSGKGRVQSRPGGIACELNCIRAEASFGMKFDALTKMVILTAQPAPGSGLVEWNGCDEVDEENQCVVVMENSKEVIARFEE